MSNDDRELDERMDEADVANGEGSPEDRGDEPDDTGRDDPA